MAQVGYQDKTEEVNRLALHLARDVAQKTGRLFAGGICNTNIYKPGDKETNTKIRKMFDEQVRWAKEEGVDYVIAETYHWLGEAEIALEVIKSHGLPAVVGFSILDVENCQTFDGVPIAEACKKMLDNGAYLAGVNCGRGPEQTIELVEKIVKLCPPEKVCALPLGYRTTEKYPTWRTLRDDACPDNHIPFPHGLEAFGVVPVEITKFTERCLELGLKYIGICCGNSGMLTNAMARAMGKETAVARYHDPQTKGTDPFKFCKKN